jgi:hypothetical protein
MTLNPLPTIMAFLEGVLYRATAERTTTDLTKLTIAARKERVEASFEAIDWANDLPTGGDEAKERIRAAFLADLADQEAILVGIRAGTLMPGEGRVAIAAAPFGSGPSATSSASGPEAIGHDRATLAPPPEKARGRGRPKGSKTRPKMPPEATETTDGTANGSATTRP